MARSLSLQRVSVVKWSHKHNEALSCTHPKWYPRANISSKVTIKNLLAPCFWPEAYARLQASMVERLDKNNRKQTNVQNEAEHFNLAPARKNPKRHSTITNSATTTKFEKDVDLLQTAPKQVCLKKTLNYRYLLPRANIGKDDILSLSTPMHKYPQIRYPFTICVSAWISANFIHYYSQRQLENVHKVLRLLLTTPSHRYSRRL